MKRVLGALLVACMCIALGLSVESSRESGMSLVDYPERASKGGSVEK